MTAYFGSEPPVHVWDGQIWSQAILKKFTFDHRTTYLPFTFLWNNDCTSSGDMKPLCHFWFIWAKILAQTPQSKYMIAKFSSKPFWKSWPLTTEPLTNPLLFCEIMTWRHLGIWNDLFILTLNDPIFWLRTPSSGVGQANLVPSHFEKVDLWPPNHLRTLYFSLK